jgi:hypothetical protein
MQLFPYYTALITLSIQRADRLAAVRFNVRRKEYFGLISGGLPYFRVDMSLLTGVHNKCHRVWIIGVAA